MAQQQGQNFSQLKDAKDEQTEVVFNPHEQVRVSISCVHFTATQTEMLKSTHNCLNCIL